MGPAYIPDSRHQTKSQDIDDYFLTILAVQVSLLEANVEVYATLASNLNSRLLATLDALDEQRFVHAEELNTERSERNLLANKLHSCQGALTLAEEERDDMRPPLHDGASSTGTVELANDYAILPHSGGFISTLTDETTEPFATYRAYAKSAISSVQEQLRWEQAAHAETARHVALLIAQVARRDAELEACVVRDPSSPPSGTASRGQRRFGSQRGPEALIQMSKTEAIEIVQFSAARSTALMREVEALLERLEKAQASPLPLPQTLANPRRSSDAVKSSPAVHQLKDPPSGPSTAALSIDGPQVSRQATTAQLSQNVDAPHVHGVTATSSGMQQRPMSRDFRTILVIEEECIRLRAAEKRAREELDALKNAVLLRPSSSQQEDGDLLADSGDERSMELATPLQPTMTLPLAPPTPSLPPFRMSDSPPSIPLPESPDDHSPPNSPPLPPADSPLAPSALSLDSPAFPGHDFELDTVALERVRAELERAEDRLREKDVELERLRRELSAMAGEDKAVGRDL
ncbi:hypothetical protein FA95DRAFT_1573641 [Auriscalpium vulgare]|uniref:Uncharacterized protein n=1 Tax=Auriscalpium vulgare TaxID=40419 RepID=A0ACB8RNM8_9AGAM|nr:hypothetical protein FA95DRAFT_1573641 [Auriscalpium vulgare]